MSNKENSGGTTQVQRWIIRYLSENRDKDVFQKDLEIRFSVRRSTMTSILQLMEKNGLIIKQEVPTDRRLKKLILTDAAMEGQETMKRRIDELEQKMRRGISDEELDAFFATAEKIGKNLEEQ